MLYQWEDRKCEGLDVNFFFDSYEENEETAKMVDKLCSSCPRQTLCLAIGVSRSEWGVWGGVYLEDGKISKVYNKHKTNDDWFNVWTSATMGIEQMLYNARVQSAVRSLRVPHDFKMDVFEYMLHPPFIALRFYHTQWERYTELERYNCTVYLKKVKEIIESFNILVTLEPIDDRTNPKV